MFPATCVSQKLAKLLLYIQSRLEYQHGATLLLMTNAVLFLGLEAVYPGPTLPFEWLWLQTQNHYAPRNNRSN